MIKFIKNTGDYFSSNYFDEDFTTKVLSKCGYGADDIKEFNKRITPLKDRFFKFKQLYIEGRLRTKDKINETNLFHTTLLNALGYNGNKTNYHKLFQLTEQEAIPVRHILYRGEQPHLMIMEMQALIKEDDTDPDGLFEQRYNVEDELLSNPPQKYHRSQWEDIFTVPEGIKISPVIINKAISELFLLEPHYRPRYILLLAGNIVYLLEQEKWFRGSYLEFDLEELFSEATASPRANYYALFYFLTSKEALSPESNMVLLDQLNEDSHKSAYEVTQDLKEGIIHAIETLANEALYYQKQILKEEYDETDNQFEQEIKDDCLRIIYRLLFIFYAESREDLDILPSNDPIYNKGYSLEMLRDLEQVPLYSETSLNGYFFHESLSKLFKVLSSGYREIENGNNKSFRVRHIDSPFFDERKLKHLYKVKFRNKIWQDIICRLSLSKKQNNRSRGRISYANLGINQLGSVYESLLAYRGFYAEVDYIEVHKKDKPTEGTYLVPRSRMDDFDNGEILKDINGDVIILNKGTFVYRLSGRDRQKSASYYTPEVLTQSTVKYTLKPILEKLDKDEMKAVDLLDLKLLEPAMGAAAFHNEMINQLAEAYIAYRQKELRDAGRIEWKVEPDKYKEELQKVKAYIATNNVYGVDLNPTAIELGKLSLWLNVIHKDMETPFFSNRICVGNAVVGAWLKVYKVSDVEQEYGTDKKPLKNQPNKAWWDNAPRQLEFKSQNDYEKIKHGRKQDEIYHFLLPDKNMVPSAGIKMLKDEYVLFTKKVTEWKKEWTKPLNKEEIENLKLISNKIDELLAEYYQFQRTINIKTCTRQNIFGAVKKNEQAELGLRSYDEKERLADQRNRHNSPYFKLKLVMDYWCSLWFWDVRQADELPSRTQFWSDIANILDLDTNKAMEGILLKRGQQNLFESITQLNMAFESDITRNEKKEVNATTDFIDAVVEYTNRKDLFDNNQRLSIVSELAKKFFFFHPQLEFLDVFWERAGFDLIAGNPPWISVGLDEKGILSTNKQEILIRKYSSPEIKKILTECIKKDSDLKLILVEESLECENLKSFITSHQNYFNLSKQRNNLYKCILNNSLLLLNIEGISGIIHPEEFYLEANEGILRQKLYSNLIYHFHFRNELKLFEGVQNQQEFCISIFYKKKDSYGFHNLYNLFHPCTIFLSLVNTLNYSELGGIKVINEQNEKFEWNLLPSCDRDIYLDKSTLSKITEVDKTTGLPNGKLPNIFSRKILQTIITLFKLDRLSKNSTFYGTDCWNEVNAINNGQIKKVTKFPDYEKNEMIFNGAHFFVSNPFYQCPIESFKRNTDYDIIDLTSINEDFFSRTNFIPGNRFEDYFNLEENNIWFENYKLAFNKMLDPASERTIRPVIIPPKTSHINSVYSVVFKTNVDLIVTTGITSSIIFDYIIKSSGASNLTIEVINNIPYINTAQSQNIFDNLTARVLRLNCLNKYYDVLWQVVYSERYNAIKWTKNDSRLSHFKFLSQKLEFESALRNSFERRQALLEIDVLVCKLLNLEIEELISIYLAQFPIVQQYEYDTWYDTKGNIVFTCSKGLIGIGLDRKEWEQIKNMQVGETYEHTITKSELYQGKKITYYAPFDKCDRVEDYKVAWKHFEEVFNKQF
ncbi:MAG: hypothetical protein NTZ33_04760 [Bacteroidetes bacterium]|nr:hypothetical protein [Bacteroidota bacterium]